ncbi:hypothetical protein [Mycolicibacterium sphagni]|nr:hypothetical protein [Mycolicibacterium sphagni]
MTAPDSDSDAEREKLLDLVRANPYMRLDPIDFPTTDGDGKADTR